MVWIGLIWLRIGTSGGLLWTRWWTFGFHKLVGSFWVAAQLAASQEGLSSMSEKRMAQWKVLEKGESEEKRATLRFLLQRNLRYWGLGSLLLCWENKLLYIVQRARSQSISCWLLSWLTFNPEEVCSTLLRNVREVLTQYTAWYPRRQYSTFLCLNRKCSKRKAWNAEQYSTVGYVGLMLIQK
jgi:hypothetical protein